MLSDPLMKTMDIGIDRDIQNQEYYTKNINGQLTFK